MTGRKTQREVRICTNIGRKMPIKLHAKPNNILLQNIILCLEYLLTDFDSEAGVFLIELIAFLLK